MDNGMGMRERKLLWGRIERLQQALAAKDRLIERLKRESEIHAQEARTANHTIAEIYQVVSGATGEPGNWHGVKPVKQRMAEKDKAYQQLLAQAIDFAKDLVFIAKYNGDCHAIAEEFLEKNK